jgi:hypothetical protein
MTDADKNLQARIDAAEIDLARYAKLIDDTRTELDAARHEIRILRARLAVVEAQRNTALTDAVVSAADLQILREDSR